jgi:hypothetical protein
MQREAFVRYYGAMPDEELTARARNFESLIDDAKGPLVDEMRRRGLPALPAYDPPSAEELEREAFLSYMRAHSSAPFSDPATGGLLFSLGTFITLMVTVLADKAVIGFIPISILLVIAGALVHKGHRLRVPDPLSTLEKDLRRHVLYLRSFKDDYRARATAGAFDFRRPKTPETRTLAPLSRIGPTIAVGEPNEALPRFGVLRFTFTDARWREGIQILMRRAVVVVIRIGPTAGVLWELELAVKTVEPLRLVLELPGIAKRDLRNATMRQEREALMQKVNAVFPVPLPEQAGFPFIHFNDEWIPEASDSPVRELAKPFVRMRAAGKS